MGGKSEATRSKALEERRQVRACAEENLYMRRQRSRLGG